MCRTQVCAMATATRTYRFSVRAAEPAALPPAPPPETSASPSAQAPEQRLLVALLEAVVRNLGRDAAGHAKALASGPQGRFWASATDACAPVGTGRVGRVAGDSEPGAGFDRERDPESDPERIVVEVALLFVGVSSGALDAAMKVAVDEAGRELGVSIDEEGRA